MEGALCGRKLVRKGQTHSPATSSVTGRASGDPCSPLHPLLLSANPEKRARGTVLCQPPTILRDKVHCGAWGKKYGFLGVLSL